MEPTGHLSEPAALLMKVTLMPTLRRSSARTADVGHQRHRSLVDLDGSVHSNLHARFIIYRRRDELVASVVTIFIGNAIVLVPMILNAHAGTKYGIPFPIYCRASFGILAANVPRGGRWLRVAGSFRHPDLDWR